MSTIPPFQQSPDSQDPEIPLAGVATPSDDAAARLAAAFGGPTPPPYRCVKHPNSQAVALCHACGAPVCATCQFTFPGAITLCPACATNPNPKMSSKRKGLVAWSIGLAIWNLLALIIMFVAIRSNSNRRDAEAMGVVFQIISFWPAVIGMALGCASFDRRLKTPGIVWLGIIGNGLIVLIWVLLMIVGATMGH